MKHFIVLISTLAICVPGEAQVRKYSNEFAQIGVGGRALGMANSVVASVDDVTAGYWNPAGLTSLSSDLEVGLMHAEYFAGIANYDFGAVAFPMKDRKRKLAISAIRFGVDDIPNTLLLIGPDNSVDYSKITSFSVADYAFLFSYAQPLPWFDLMGGASVKIIHRSAGGFAKAWGFGFDIGVTKTMEHLRFGAVLRDATTTFNAWSFSFSDEERQALINTGNVVPESSYELTAPRLILGGAYKRALSENFSLSGELNLDITTDGRRNTLISAKPVSIDPHIGTELDFKRIVYVRVGIGNVQRKLSEKAVEVNGVVELSEQTILSLQPNAGIGFRLGRLAIDYAFTDIGGGASSLYSHVFSAQLRLNKKTE